MVALLFLCLCCTAFSNSRATVVGGSFKSFL